METQYIVTLSVLAGVLLLFLILYFIFQSVQKNLEKYIQENFDPEEIIGATTRANFLGIKSKAGMQIRGNGAMILTKDRLLFIRAAPFKKYVISVNSINNVSLPRSFNGKSVFAKLLCVQYQINGVEESIAWAIRNPTRWKESIEGLIGRRD